MDGSHFCIIEMIKLFHFSARDLFGCAGRSTGFFRRRNLSNRNAARICIIDLHMPKEVTNDAEVKKLRSGIFPDLLDNFAFRLDDSDDRVRLVAALST